MEKYINFLAQQLKELLPELRVLVTDYAYQSFNGDLYDVICVISANGGNTSSNDVAVQPVSIQVWSCGNLTKINNEGENSHITFDDVIDGFNQFVKDNNGISIILDDGTYVKQNYMLPLVNSPIDLDGGSYRSSFVVSGALTINKNIFDVQKVLINGQDINFLTFNINYSTMVTNSKTGNNYIMRETINRGIISFSLTCYNRRDILGQTFKSIVTEELPSNYVLTMRIVFNDNNVIDYRVVIYSASGSVDRANPMSMSYVLHLAKES